MTARFDVEAFKIRTNLVLSVDGESLARYQEDEKGERLLHALRKAKIFGIEEAHQQQAAILTMRSASLSNYRDAPEVSVKVLDTLYNLAEPDETLPQMRMTHEVLDRGANRYGMMVAIRWPTAEPRTAAQFATRHMQRFASSVNLNGNQRMNVADDMVYVTADRARGITVETNPLGSCNIGAGGCDYDPESDVVELWQHNIYNPAQQLVCLIGAVGFATADLHGIDK